MASGDSYALNFSILSDVTPTYVSEDYSATEESYQRH